jgi:energy-coupling factor transport system ATP-binding protein
MEDIAKYVDRMIVMDNGKIRFDGKPEEVFARVGELEKIGLAAPEVTYLLRDLRASGLPVNENIITAEAAVKEILNALQSGR